MEYVKARVTATRQVIYADADGIEMVREGGSRAWRNNNPGNISKGSFAVAHGAIGGDERFAIFPDEATGRAAIVALLRTPSYAKLSLADAIDRYAPPVENDTQGYVGFVAKRTGIAPETILGTLGLKPLAALADAIRQVEGWRPGKEYPNVAAPLVVADGPAKPLSSAGAAAQDWMTRALAEAALPATERSEWADPGENPRILNYFAVAAPWFDAREEGGDEVDWCAAFVNYCLESAGYAGTGHPGARSFYWSRNKHFVSIAKPIYGCIVVLRDAPYTDPEWKTGTGHVGFAVDWTASHITLLGGNQGKTVRTKPYEIEGATRKVAAYLLPAMN